MIDQVAIQQNEKLLGDLLDNGNKKFVSLIGVVALGLLSEHLEPQAYKAFVDQCVENAHEFMKQKLLNEKSGKQQPEGSTQ